MYLNPIGLPVLFGLITTLITSLFIFHFPSCYQITFPIKEKGGKN